MTPPARFVSALLLAALAVSEAAAAERPMALDRVLAVTDLPGASKTKSRGLAGTEGNVRRKVMFTASMTGGCAAMHRRYIAAAGHSAFASTPINHFYGANVCAVGLNASNTSAAEAKALATCRAGLKKYKSVGEQGISGTCEIYMSK